MKKNLDGTLVRGVGGFYYVVAGFDEYVCKARGRFRNAKLSPLVGDKVMIEVPNESERIGSIEKIYPRKNEMIRPKVSNVDQAVIVFSLKEPELNTVMLDTFLILAESACLHVLIVLNKADISDIADIIKVQSIYEKCGYRVLYTSIKTGQGIRELRNEFYGKASVFAGPSGVGKSSLINAVFSDEKMETGEVSQKIKRGKHTTRHAELIRFDDNTFIVDTPGFTSLSIEHIEKKDLADYFPEFAEFVSGCKFTGCSHMKEMGCSVIENIGRKIHGERYERYKIMYNELANIRRY